MLLPCRSGGLPHSNGDFHPPGLSEDMRLTSDLLTKAIDDTAAALPDDVFGPNDLQQQQQRQGGANDVRMHLQRGGMAGRRGGGGEGGRRGRMPMRGGAGMAPAGRGYGRGGGRGGEPLPDGVGEGGGQRRRDGALGGQPPGMHPGVHPQQRPQRMQHPEANGGVDLGMRGVPDMWAGGRGRGEMMRGGRGAGRGGRGPVRSAGQPAATTWVPVPQQVQGV
jgi:hypothetical protein